MTLNQNIENLRREYSREELKKSEVSENPIEQFGKWFDEALQANVFEPNAMTLATVNEKNEPAARIVLLKGYGDEGFVFYTNYQSRKGEELSRNNRASLLFFWKELERQIRIDGLVAKTSAETSTAYFQSRPKASQIGALVSPQSSVVESREWLEKRYEETAEQFAETDKLPRPEHWGGYVVKPIRIEFWQGRPSRLHDRILYTLVNDNQPRWIIERLAP